MFGKMRKALAWILLMVFCMYIPAMAEDTGIAVLPSPMPEGATPAPEEEESSTQAGVYGFEPTMMGQMGITVEDWLMTSDNRAYFIALLTLELSFNPQIPFTEMFMEFLSSCEIYTTTSAEGEGLDIEAFFFMDDLKACWMVMYVPILGQATATCMPYEDIPEVYMAMLRMNGSIGEYQNVPLTDFSQAMQEIIAALFPEETPAPEMQEEPAA